MYARLKRLTLVQHLFFWPGLIGLVHLAGRIAWQFIS
jgi:hypothetical protein